MQQRQLQRPVGAALLLAAAAWLAGCAGLPAAAPEGATWRPAQRSTLLSQRAVGFVVTQWPTDTGTVTLLARTRPGAQPQPVARLLQVGQGVAARVTVQRWPDRGSDVHELAALEQLYVLLLRLEPQARYCRADAPCEAEPAGGSHAQLLQHIAALREPVAARTPGALPWQVVRLQAAPVPSWDADLVGVRAAADRGPLHGSAIHFNRAPHSICHVPTRADGVASCRLEDQHGDGQAHDHATTVVATYPGEVRADRVLLPTTHVMPRLAATQTVPDFARPFTLARP